MLVFHVLRISIHELFPDEMIQMVHDDTTALYMSKFFILESGNLIEVFIIKWLNIMSRRPGYLIYIFSFKRSNL